MTTPRILNAGYPIRPITWPSAAVCDENGRMTSNRLRSIGSGGRLEASRVASAWNALYIAAAADGFTGDDAFTWTPGGTYRTFDQQHSVFVIRWRPWQPSTPGEQPPRGAAFYMGGWWVLREGQERVAVPGTSNHGRAVAIDVALGRDMNNARPITQPAPLAGHSTGLAWLLRPAPEQYRTDPAVMFTWPPGGGRELTNAESLGWSWEGTASTARVEPWHLRYFPGDAWPRRVLDVLAFVGVKP